MSGLEDVKENSQKVEGDANQREDSYTEQIASLDIENTKLPQHDERNRCISEPGQEQETNNEQSQIDVSGADVTGNDSDEEFRLMDERIANQVIYEKRK